MSDTDEKRAKARARKILTQENRKKAVELRRMGYTYEFIGQQLCMTAQSAHRTVKKAMDLIRKEQDEDAEYLRAIELANLDRAETYIWPSISKGSVQHIDRLLKIQERRAKLTGIDAPTKTAQTDSKGNDLVGQYLNMTPEEREARIRELEAQRAERSQ